MMEMETITKDNNKPIVVTKREDELIQKVKLNINFNTTDRLKELYFGTGFTLTTIARILEGEKYTVEYDYQVGDILMVRDNGHITRIVPNRTPIDTYTNTLDYVINNPSKFKLVAKSEHVEKGVFQ